jgi:hypothetical protein
MKGMFKRYDCRTPGVGTAGRRVRDTEVLLGPSRAGVAAVAGVATIVPGGPGGRGAVAGAHRVERAGQADQDASFALSHLPSRSASVPSPAPRGVTHHTRLCQ